MEICSDRHDLVYRIRYKPSQPDASITEWKVCEQCFEKNIFSDEKTIESITVIKNNKESKVDIEKISILTHKFTRKLKTLFSKQ